MRRFVLIIILFLPFQANASQLKVLTFNTWLVRTALKDFAEQVDERTKLLPLYLNSTNADIIALQEVWDEELRDQIVSEMKNMGYTYSATAGRPSMGNGLLLLSKFELSSHVELLEFSDYTAFDEYFVKKGAIKAKANVPNIGWVDFFVSHLGAVTFDEGSNEYNHDHERIRANQAKELVNFIRYNTEYPLTFVAADLNANYNKWINGRYTNEPSNEYKLMTEYLRLVDSFMSLNRDHLPLWTFDPKTNPYAGDGFFSVIPSELIDYIFVSSSPRISTTKSDLVLNEDIPQSKCDSLGIQICPKRLSDHSGVMSTFEINL
jgi:endonuclease/exonuclease/phosphatase family metal-dependent hydrolase